MRIIHLLWHGRRWIATAVFLFVLGAIGGYLAAMTEPERLQAQLRPLLEFVGGVAERVVRAPSPLERTWIIYRQNAQSLSVMMLGGLALGLIPALGLLGNGAMVGAVVGLGQQLSPERFDAWRIFITLAPHGVIELPAVWIGTAWAMKLGLAYLAPAAAGQRWAVFRQTAREAAVVLVVAMVLLFIAAAIEANLTLALARRVGP
jgi:stage II sporulation protein M